MANKKISAMNPNPAPLTGAEQMEIVQSGVTYRTTLTEVAALAPPQGVTSVGLALPISVFDISNSPVSSTGTLTGSFKTKPANMFFAGPAYGAPGVPDFRFLSAFDIPDLSGSYIQRSPVSQQTGFFNVSAASTVGNTLTATVFLASGTTTKANPHYSFVGTPNAGMWLSAANQISLVNNGLNRVHIETTGNVAFRNSSDTGNNVNYIAAGNGQMAAASTATVSAFTILRPSGTGNGISVDITGSTSGSPGVFQLSASGTTNQTTVALFRIFDPTPQWSAAYAELLKNSVSLWKIDNAGFMGLNNATPLSHIDIIGSIGFKIQTITTTTTLDTTHHTILVDATGGNVTLNLPTAASANRRIYRVKLISATNSVTIDGNASETIDGATTQVISTQYGFLTIQSNGTAWFIIAS